MAVLLQSSNTGLSLGQSLLSALKEQIDVQAKALDREGKALASIPKQLAKFKREMQKDASIQYSNVERVLDNAMKATDELTDSLLSLGNTEAISNYVLNAKSMQVTDTSGFDVLRNFETGLKSWTNSSRQKVENREFLEANNKLKFWLKK